MKPLLSASFFWILLVAACGVDYSEKPQDPPTITHRLPEILPAEGGQIELHLSKPVMNYRNVEGCFRLAKRGSVTQAMIKRAAKMQNPQTEPPFLPVSIELSASRDKILISVGERLEYNESYSLYVFECLRDDGGMPLSSSEHHFVVEDAPFRILSHDVVLPGDSLAQPGRKYFHFRFSHPIGYADPSCLKIGEIPAHSTVSEDKHSLVVSLLGDLLPDSFYLVQISALLKDESGRNVSGDTISFQTASDTSRTRFPVFRSFQVMGYDSHVDVDVSVLYLFRLSVRIGDKMQQGPGSMRIEGLKPNTRYDFEIEAETLFGEKELKKGTVKTRPEPTISINEVLASPKLSKGVSDSAGEFIELFNFGSHPVNLADFTIEVDSKQCALHVKDSSFLILPPKSYMILVGRRFDPRAFDLPLGSAIFRMPAQTICGNLRNWPMPTIILKDELGRKIDQFSGMPEAKERGFSAERLNPAEKHGKERYCYSRVDVGPTPLRTNGVTEKGCE